MMHFSPWFLPMFIVRTEAYPHLWQYKIYILWSNAPVYKHNRLLWPLLNFLDPHLQRYLFCRACCTMLMGYCLYGKQRTYIHSRFPELLANVRRSSGRHLALLYTRDRTVHFTGCTQECSVNILTTDCCYLSVKEILQLSSLHNCNQRSGGATAPPPKSVPGS